MANVVKPFDKYRVQYGTVNGEGREITRIDFFHQGTKVGRLLSGNAIAPGSYVSFKNGVIDLYFRFSLLANALAILEHESDLALYFVPDDENPQQEQGREGGICHR